MTSMVFTDATRAYRAWCRHHGRPTIHRLIDDAVSAGRSRLDYRGFLPPEVVEDLRARGYHVGEVCLAHAADPLETHYIVAWAG